MPRNVMFCLAFCAFCGPALAGGVTEPAPAPPVSRALPPAVSDWSGFYAGLGYGRVGGTASDGFEDLDLDAGSAPAGFVGFNGQGGQLVYGIELSYAAASDVAVNGQMVDGVDGIIELSGRLGHATGRALVYGRIGYARTSYDMGAGEIDFDGIAYGLGLDYLVTDSFAVGLSYTRYDLSPREGTSAPGLDPEQVGLRISMKF